MVSREFPPKLDLHETRRVDRKMATSPTPLEMLGTVKSVALFEGEFSWVFWVCLVGYCAGNCAAMLKANPKIRFVHGLVLLTMNSFGGSTVAAILCGQPVPFVVNEKLMVGLVGTWVVCYLLPGLPNMIKGTSVGSLFISICFETLCRPWVGGVATAHA